MISKIQIDIWKTKASIFGKNVHYLKIGPSRGRVRADSGQSHGQSHSQSWDRVQPE